MKTLPLFATLFLAGTAHAGNEEASRLLCQGEFSSLKEPRVAEAKVEGIFVQIDKNSVKIELAPGFSGNYQITSQLESGIRFEDGDGRHGFLNRFSGVLSLSIEDKPAKKKASDVTRLSQHIDATCAKATPPLF